MFKTKHTHTVSKFALGLFALCFLSISAQAASLGTYLGTFSGNDSESALSQALGLDADEISRIELPSISNGSFSITASVLNDDNEILAGQWNYTGTEIMTHIIIKAGNEFAVYYFDDGLNSGMFNTSDVNNRGLSHITGYAATAVPVPAALWLFGGGLLSLMGLRTKN